MPGIKVIPPEQAFGKLKEVYDELISKRGKLSEVLMIQSLHPDSLSSHVNFYMDIMFSNSIVKS